MGKFIIKEKINRKKRELKKLRKKEIKDKRQKRKIKLIKLGTLFLITNLLDETQEKIVGYLEKFLYLSIVDRNKLILTGEKILEKKEKIEYEMEDISKRKNMFFKMIRKGALVEKLKIHMEDPKILLGYISSYKNLSMEEKKALEERGKIILSAENKKLDNQVISEKEKIDLLKKSFLMKIDLTKLLKENYNLTIHEVKKNQINEIMKKIENYKLL